MKRFLISLSLLVLSSQAFAAYVTAGNILQAPVKKNTSTGYLTLDIDPTSFAGVSITSSDTNSFAWLTTTAAGSAARGGSITAIALTSTVLVNITSAAGADVPCIVTIEGGAGPNAGLYWGILPSSTWLAPVTYLAVSTTPIMVTVGRGDHLQLSATAAAVTVNARVRYAPIQ